MPPTRHQLRFPATLAGLDRAAGELRHILDTCGLSGDPRYNVELTFEEIAANIVRHASATREVEVSVDFAGDETSLLFEDDGIPFDPCARPAPTLPSSLDDAPVGGLGVMLVKHVASHMAYERTSDDRNRLTVIVPNH